MGHPDAWDIGVGSATAWLGLGQMQYKCRPFFISCRVNFKEPRREAEDFGTSFL